MKMMNTSFSTNSPNVTISGESDEISLCTKIMLYVAYFSVIAVGTVGNTMVLYHRAFKCKRKKTSHDYQTISLAIADLLGSIFTPIAFLIDLSSELKLWERMGTFGCKFLGTANMFLMVTSAWTMTAIGLTRLRY